MERKILIIDDDEPMRLLIDYLLRDKYDLSFKENGLQGMQWIMDGNIPDLILCDFVLPKMNGFDFLSQLSDHADFRDLSFIMMSSRIDDHFKKQCLDKGAKGFLEKPFDPQQLMKVIGLALD